LWNAEYFENYCGIYLFYSEESETKENSKILWQLCSTTGEILVSPTSSAEIA
jgi:hypothetical protein